MSLYGLLILLAEDNPTNQMVAMHMLESLGATVELAQDGAEALDMLQHKTYDVALIDIEMPRISGIDLIRRLRALDNELSEMPLIALTAYVMREHRAAIDDAGADGLIAKPIQSIEQFGAEIVGYMRLRERSSPAQAALENMTVPADMPGIDRDTYERLMVSFAGSACDELVGKITSDIADAANRIEASLLNHDLATICSASHILVSVAGTIGAIRLRDLAKCLNSAGHTADIEVIDRDGPELVGEAGRVLDFVRKN